MHNSLEQLALMTNSSATAPSLTNSVTDTASAVSSSAISSALHSWLEPWLLVAGTEPTCVAGDASFRKYYRFSAQQTKLKRSLILMDAPPELESSAGFIALAQAWREKGVRVPEVIAFDLELGAALLEDFGQVQLMQAVTAQPAQADALYRQALRQLVSLQKLDAKAAAAHELPLYDAALLNTELELFDTWLVQKLLGLPAQSFPAGWAEFKHQLVQQALAQPQVCVHRDFHSRNLMHLGSSVELGVEIELGADIELSRDLELGIIDFQDAVIGPCTYDAVSLIKDCYLDWPLEQQTAWLEYFYELSAANLTPKPSWAEFAHWWQLMGMQRHLKAAGIFARLYLRDGKASFLSDLPLTLKHLIRACKAYPEFAAPAAWLENTIAPQVEAFLQTSNFLKPAKVSYV